MNNSVFIWIVIFAVAAIGFFVIAAVVAVKGFFDLRLLLRYSNHRGEFETESDVAGEKFSD